MLAPEFSKCIVVSTCPCDAASISGVLQCEHSPSWNSTPQYAVHVYAAWCSKRACYYNWSQGLHYNKKPTCTTSRLKDGEHMHVQLCSMHVHAVSYRYRPFTSPDIHTQCMLCIALFDTDGDHHVLHNQQTQNYSIHGIWYWLNISLISQAITGYIVINSFSNQSVYLKS